MFGVDIKNHTPFPLRAVDSLKPHPQNPNFHPRAQIDALCEILVENGWRSPVVVSRRSGLVIKGHGRMAAAERLGVPVPVEEQDYEDEAAEVRDLIADNKIQELSQLDEGVVADLVKKFRLKAGLGNVAKTGAFEARLKSVADKAPEKRKFPIVILENEEQEKMFSRIKADFRSKSDASAFAKILVKFYMDKYGEEDG